MQKSSSAAPSVFKHPTIAEMFGAQMVAKRQQEQKRIVKVSPHLVSTLQPVKSLSTAGRETKGDDRVSASSIALSSRKRKRWMSADDDDPKGRKRHGSEWSSSSSSSSSSDDDHDHSENDRDVTSASNTSTKAAKRTTSTLQSVTAAASSLPANSKVESAADALARSILGGFQSQLTATSRLRTSKHEVAKGHAVTDLGTLTFAQRYRPLSIADMKLHSRPRMMDHDRTMMAWLESRRAEPLIGFQAALVSGPCGSGKDLWAELRLRECGYTTIVRLAHGDTGSAALEGKATGASLSLNEHRIALNLDTFYEEGIKGSLKSTVARTAILISDIDAFDSDTFSLTELCKLLTLHQPKVEGRIRKRRNAKRKADQERLQDAAESKKKKAARRTSFKKRVAAEDEEEAHDSGSGNDTSSDRDNKSDKETGSASKPTSKAKTKSKRKLGSQGNQQSATLFGLPLKYSSPILCPIIMTTSLVPKASSRLKTLLANTQHFPLESYPTRALTDMMARVCLDQKLTLSSEEQDDLVRLCKGDAQKLHVMLQFHKSSGPCDDAQCVYCRTYAALSIDRKAAVEQHAPTSSALRDDNKDGADLVHQSDTFLQSTFATTKQLYNGSISVLRRARHLHDEFCRAQCKRQFVSSSEDVTHDLYDVVMPGVDLIEAFMTCNWLQAMVGNQRSQEESSLADCLDMAEMADLAGDIDCLGSAEVDFFHGPSAEAGALLAVWGLPTLVQMHLSPSRAKKSATKLIQRLEGSGAHRRLGREFEAANLMLVRDELFAERRSEDRTCRSFLVEFPRSIGPFRPPKALVTAMNDLSASVYQSLALSEKRPEAGMDTLSCRTRNYADWWISILGPALCCSVEGGAAEWLADYSAYGLELKEAKSAERKQTKLEKDNFIQEHGKPPPRKRRKLDNGKDAKYEGKRGKVKATAVDPLHAAILAGRLAQANRNKDKLAAMEQGMLLGVSDLLSEYGFHTHKQVVELLRLSLLFSKKRGGVGGKDKDKDKGATKKKA